METHSNKNNIFCKTSKKLYHNSLLRNFNEICNSSKNRYIEYYTISHFFFKYFTIITKDALFATKSMEQFDK